MWRHDECFSFGRLERVTNIRDKKDRPGWFEQLKSQQEEIQSDFGSELYRDDRENISHQRVSITRKFDMTMKENWPSAIEWMLEQMQKMKGVFKSRVMTLSHEVAVAADAVE